VRVGEETYSVRSGDIVIIPAGAAHGIRNAGRAVVRVRAVFPAHRIDAKSTDANLTNAPDGTPTHSQLGNVP
jgi:quercetin dioxygenase-like cupin family protein